MRVYELAKEIGMPSKELVTLLIDLGHDDVKSHSSSITEGDAGRVRNHLAKLAAAAAEAAGEPPPAAEAPAPEPEPPVEETAPPEAEAPAEPDAPAPEAPAAEDAPPEEAPPAEEAPVEEEPRSMTVSIKGPIVVRDLAELINTKPNLIIAELMQMNMFASINEKLDIRIAHKLAHKHGYTIELEKKPEKKPPPPKKKVAPIEPEQDDPDTLSSRPPIVTLMGHVDHGKTSILDAIRKAKVAAGESGGITQHIGAYTIETDGKAITFLDTPGHAAFTAMRARGAHLTDIAIIVVAADDGLMPQTREAIQHAKASDVSIMIAINKMDLPAANPDRVKQQLQEEGLVVEDWGGEIIAMPVSAQTGEGINELLEYIHLQAELLELKANPNRTAKGYVVEAQLEPGMGPTASLLVKRGTLNLGDSLVCGPHWGRVKALINDQGTKVKKAGPSIPVKCLGLSGVPDAGALFEVAANPKEAKAIAEERALALKQEDQVPARKASLEDLLSATDPNEKLELPLVLKADVQGSVEALKQALAEIESEKIAIKFLLTGVGNVTTNDVLLASASDSIVIGFHVPLENGAAALAKREGVEIRTYTIIYQLVDEVREAMTGMLAPDERENILGQAQIRQIFELSNKGRVAGCMITKGRVRAKARARIRRGDTIVYEGRLSNLRRFQNDANEVREGQECGMRIDNFANFEVGDVIETFEVQKVAAHL